MRCYLDEADGANARSVIQTYQGIDNHSAVFSYTSVFIEIVSLSLQEEGASMGVITDLLREAHKHNPYVIWLLTYAHLFEEMMPSIDQLISTKAALNNNSEVTPVSEAEDAHYSIEFPPNCLEEALIYYRLDCSLWQEIESSTDILASFIHSEKLLPDVVELASEPEDIANNSSSSVGEEAASVEAEGEECEGGIMDAIESCYNMYNMGVKIILKELK